MTWGEGRKIEGDGWGGERKIGVPGKSKDLNGVMEEFFIYLICILSGVV